jgi:hypothetical protein
MLLKRWGYECAIVRPDGPATSRRLDRALAKVVAPRPRLAPAAEHILLDGCRITDQSSHRRGIGMAVPAPRVAGGGEAQIVADSYAGGETVEAA